MNILHLTLKKEWFDKIASGEKKIEYRDYKKYWIDRLFNKDGSHKDFDIIRFRNGYNKNCPTMDIIYKKTEIMNGRLTDLQKDGLVIGLYLGEILEVKRRPKNVI